MTGSKQGIVMVGPFPPPVTGMSNVNAYVYERLLASGDQPIVIDMSPKSLARSWSVRLSRLPRLVRALIKLACLRGTRGRPLWITASPFDFPVVALARVLGMRLFMNHQVFAYLDRPHFLARMLMATAGPDAVHITQSPGMSARMQERYGVRWVSSASNAILLDRAKVVAIERTELARIGFISNISEEKGIFDFLSVCEWLAAAHPELEARLAGPFQDAHTEQAVRRRMAELPNLSYEGPLYGSDKDRFFAAIDVFIFPTRYRNETEGIVNHEAMSRGVPVIAFGRGCIPEIIGSEAGCVVPPGADFLTPAKAQLDEWVASPHRYRASSAAAARQFAAIRQRSEARWRQLLEAMQTGNMLSEAALDNRSDFG